MHGGIHDHILENQLMFLVEIHMFFISILTSPMFLRPADFRVFLRRLLGSSSHEAGQALALIVAFSSREFRCFGTGTRVASIN